MVDNRFDIMTDTTLREKEQPKHRACDECRSRKLACSKEADGCARCKKEGIVCHYSPQKPMGRPRKRPCPDNDIKQQRPKQQQQQQSHKEAQNPSSPVTSRTPSNKSAPASNPTRASRPVVTTTAATPAVATADVANIFDPVALGTDFDPALDPDWSLLDNAAGDMSFLDFMNLDPNQPFDPAFVPPEALSLTYPVEEPKPMSKWQFGIGGLFDGGAFNDLSLDVVNPITCSDETSTAPSPENSLGATPSLTSDSSHHSPSDNPSPPSPPPHIHPPRTHVPCVCLANMYLALDRLQHLPTGVRDAMCAARYGARVAHDCMQCPSCSTPMLTEAVAPIQSFQNMMILGALLPVLANAYMHIIPMIDQEAQQATAERRKLFFSIPEFGGVWGRMADQKACQASEHLQGDMEPTLWRQIVRAMLKLDVYGMDSCGTAGDKFKQIGLRDIVDRMEERSVKRHEIFENPELQKTMQRVQCTQAQNLAPGQKPTCLQIIGLAKQAVESIVIA